MSRNYKFNNPSAAYFVSFATVYWIEVFTRQLYLGILKDSIMYCRLHKKMKVYAYCFMPNHVHLVFSSENEDPSGIIRDFKKFTAKKVIKAIENNPRESRKQWMLNMFEKAANYKTNVEKRQFWQHHNHPIELWSRAVMKQKINYIHNNPVVAGFVTNPIDWKYSSARNFQDDHSILPIDNIGLLI